jgi:hypothetical protein
VASTIAHIGASVPQFIRVEGFMSVGKTLFATELAKRLRGQLISSDTFLVGDTSGRPYWQCLRLEELRDAVRALNGSDGPVVFEGICSRELLPPEKFGLGYVIYLKRLSFNNPETPSWGEGYWLSGDCPAQELHKSIHRYHLRFRPHEDAHLILEIPEDGHSLRGPHLH